MFNVVLYEPEIPQNTGNIMRTCAAFGLRLHLIEPLGFKLDEKHLKRARLDYTQYLAFSLYHDFDDFKAKNRGRYVCFSRYGLKDFSECDLKLKDNEAIYLLFGKESTGIPRTILRDYLDDTYRLPMIKEARSLNLSNCVAIGAYELIKQNDFPHLSKHEVIKGKDWILK